MAPPSKSNKRLYISTTLASLTAFLFGYSVGIIGGILVLPSFSSYFSLSNLSATALANARTRIVILWLVGAALGALCPLLFKGLGRRGGLRLCGFLYVLGAIVMVVAQEGERGRRVLEVGRFLNGLGVGVGTLVGPIFISEVSPPSKRAMIMSGYQTSLQIGALLGFWGAFLTNSILPCTSNLQWQFPIALQILFGLFLISGTLYVPETPRYYIERKRLEDARNALAWFRSVEVGSEEVEEEMEEEMEAMCNAIEVIQGRKEYATSFWKECRKVDVWRRLYVGIGLMALQNLVGLNAINYYAPVIFMSAGFKSVSASLFLTGLFGLVKLVSAIAFMFVFVKMKGNRFWLKFGSGVCAVSMVVLAYYVKVLPSPGDDANPKPSVGGIIAVLMVYIFTFSFGVSLGPISWNICSEIFPLHINSKCCAITTYTQWVFQIIIASITPYLLNSIGWATYLVFAGFCTIAFVWVSLVVPETRGVAIGRPMDDLFMKREVQSDASSGTSETASLLRNEHRRSSLVAYA